MELDSGVAARPSCPHYGFLLNRDKRTMVDKENNGCALAQNAPCLYSDDVPHGPDWSCCIKRDDNASMLLVKIMEAGTVVYPAGYPDGLPYKQWSRLLTTHREAAAAKA